MKKDKPTVITGTIGVDAHVIGTKVLSRALRDAGFNVVELGALTPPEEFIKAAQETDADAMLISSLYGMAELDVRALKRNASRRPGRCSAVYRRDPGRSRHDFEETW